MQEKIVEGLAKLDVDNNDHWTSDGLPRLDVLKDFIGTPVSRSDISAAAKGFSRKTPNLEIEAPENTASGEVVDAKTEEPQKTESVQTSDVPEITPSETVEEVNADAEVEAELVAANEAYTKAKARLDRANAEMDVVIIRREQEAQNGRLPATDIQAYQMAQAKQRAATAKQRQAIAAAVSSAKTKF